MAKMMTGDERFSTNIPYHLGVMTATLEALGAEVDRLTEEDAEAYKSLRKLIDRLSASFPVVARVVELS